jgi:hypothetical protein
MNREQASGTYCTSAYFLSSFTVEFPILLVIVICYGCISYWMVGFDPNIFHFLYFLAIIFAVIQVGFSVSQLISAGKHLFYIHITMKFFKNYKFSLLFLHIKKFIFEKLDCHLLYMISLII